MCLIKRKRRVCYRYPTCIQKTTFTLDKLHGQGISVDLVDLVSSKAIYKHRSPESSHVLPECETLACNDLFLRPAADVLPPPLVDVALLDAGGVLPRPDAPLWLPWALACPPRASLKSGL